MSQDFSLPFCFRACLLLISATTALPATADFEEAVSAYQNQKFEVAYQEFRRLAELGDGPSQRNVAAMYARGEYVNKDPIEAWAWAALSSQLVDNAALKTRIQSRLSEIELAQANARLSTLQAQYGQQVLESTLLPVVADRIADCTVDIIGDAAPVKTTPPNYPSFAARDGITGYACATFYISDEGTVLRPLIYEASASYSGKRRGDGRPDQDTFSKVSLDALKKWRFLPAASAALREVPSKYCMDFKLDDTNFSEWKAEKQEIEEQKSAAIQGDPRAQFKLAVRAEHQSSSTGVKESTRKQLKEGARLLYQQSAFGGYADGQFKLAKDLLTGNQCEKDVKKGVAWLTFAAQQGHTESQYLLASKLLHGEGVEINAQKAGQWLKAAAEAGHGRAKIEYALYLLRYAPEQKDRAISFLPDTPNEYNLGELETFALARALTGDFAQAVQFQTQALAIATEIGTESQTRQMALSRYQANELPSAPAEN